MDKQSRIRTAIVVAGCAAALAACSSGTSTSSSTHTAAPRTTSPTASPASQATCKHVNSLRASLETLTHLQLNASSAGQIRTNLTNIQSQLSALKSEGGTGAFSHQVNQLSNSLDQVERAAKGLGSPPSAGQVSKVVTALSGLRAQSKSTVAAMRAACPKG